MAFSKNEINYTEEDFDKTDKRTSFRYSSHANDITIEAEIFEKSSGNPVIARGSIINISKTGLLIVLDMKNLNIAQFVKFRIFMSNPSIVFEDNGRIMWGMETGNKMYYGIKMGNMEFSAGGNDFYQYMMDNGLLFKKHKLD